MCGEGRGESERAAEFAAILEAFIRFRKREAIERRDRAEPLGHIVRTYNVSTRTISRGSRRKQLQLLTVAPLPGKREHYAIYSPIIGC